MTKKLSTLVLSILLAVVPASVQAEVLDEIRETSVLKVGVRVDAFPFGYLNSNGELVGYCLNFINSLRQRIKQELNKDALLIQLYRTSTVDRFNLIDDDIAHLECGPNTIREDLPFNIEFSAPFFVTGTQFLVQKDRAINPNSNLANVTIGVLSRTSTEELITDRYPQATIEAFQGATGRTRGIQALKRGQIDAFASDGILLLGEATQQGLSLNNYQLVPERPLTCDRYGMILPANDPQWRNLVNSVLENQQLQQDLNNWFASAFPQSNLENCD